MFDWLKKICSKKDEASVAEEPKQEIPSAPETPASIETPAAPEAPKESENPSPFSE